LEFEISKSSPANVTPKGVQKRSGISPGMANFQGHGHAGEIW